MKYPITKLDENGYIPAHKECPFWKYCCPKTYGQGIGCKHTGVNHSVPFSCAMARGFDLNAENYPNDA